MAEVGSLAALWRYPVKSMSGERVLAGRVLAEHGLQGDRGYALLDVETGRIASAKHPRRWGGLLAAHARVEGALAEGQRRGPVVLALPGGLRVRGDQVDVDAALSSALGRVVRLVDSPPPQAVYAEVAPGSEVVQRAPLAVGAGVGSLFDFAPIHILTTASLARLAALAPGSQIAMERFRPNLVIDTGPAEGFVEQAWIGRIVAIGDHVRLYITFVCPRCVMTTLAQGALAADPAVLRAVAAHNMQMFPLLARKVAALGVYATVVRGGPIAVGDAVRLEGRAPLRRAAALVHAIKRAVRRR